ncbi:hypothetical protein AB0M36_32555 [Actinoplanes sp. NPDC051346]|uniref:hypothetical protein n=1 Tax=Actinoplanes sp. NPDC051346 TaxID=3155048 RepID=UPI003425E8F7
MDDRTRDPLRSLVAALEGAGIALGTHPVAPDAGALRSPEPDERFRPEEVREALSRVGQVRRAYLREALEQGFPAEEMLTATSRIDLLVAAVGDDSFGHRRTAALVWPTLGRLLRGPLGRRPTAWLATAALLPRHPGTLRGVLRRTAGPDAPRPPAEAVDLRVLTLAPDRVLAAVLDAWSDDDLHQIGAAQDRSGRRAELVERGLRGGARPRREYVTWVRAVPGAASAETLVGLSGVLAGTLLEQDVAIRALRDVALRRRFAALLPPPDPSVDLIAALRGCAGAVEAEAVLVAALPDGAAPSWPPLVAAHADDPLPTHSVAALADRPGFPEALLDGLPYRPLAHAGNAGRPFALAALRRDDWTMPPMLWRAALTSLLCAGTLSVDEVLAAARPAVAVLEWALAAPPVGPPWHDPAAARKDLVRVALAEKVTALFAALPAVPPRNWPAIARLLPDFAGTVPDLLAVARA